MKLFNKKIKAFTISEMLIVLVISSIVVGLSLTVLNLVQKQMNTIKNTYVSNTEVRLLERTLLQDFNRYSLFCNSQANELIGFSIKDTVVYRFTETQVIRNQDTLGVAIFKSNFYLDGNKVDRKSIDAVELQLSKQFPEKKLFISKTNDAAFYMNNGI